MCMSGRGFACARQIGVACVRRIGVACARLLLNLCGALCFSPTLRGLFGLVLSCETSRETLTKQQTHMASTDVALYMDNQTQKEIQDLAQCIDLFF